MSESFLLNHLWQSTVFALVAAALAALLRRNQARVRFAIWMAASLKFLLPFSLLIAAGRSLAGWWTVPRTLAAPVKAAVALTVPFHELYLNGVVVTPSRSWTLGWGEVAPAMAAIALLGSAALLLRWGVRAFRLARIVRAARPGELAGAAVRLTSSAVEPGIAGVFRPVMLLPEGLDRRLSPEQLKAIVAHELCHARRRDNFWAALHMVVETVFWFHPLVWWIGARLVAERERACDEAVLRHGRDREAYAGGMLAVCRHYLESPLACAAGVTGGSLAGRVAAILQGRTGHRLGLAQKLLLAGVGLAALAGPVAAGALMATAAPTTLTVATITPAPGSNGGDEASLRIVRRKIQLDNMPLRQVVQIAYGLRPYQLDGPAWMETERFNVSAPMAKRFQLDQPVPVLQQLLVRRFHLSTHEETRNMQVFALMRAPGDAVRLVPDGGGNVVLHYRIADRKAEMDGAAGMDQLAELLTTPARAPVLNFTGMTGSYKLQLHLAPASPDQPAAAAVAQALKKQLGLTLESQPKRVPILIVDHADRVPH